MSQSSRAINEQNIGIGDFARGKVVNNYGIHTQKQQDSSRTVVHQNINGMGNTVSGTGDVYCDMGITRKFSVTARKESLVDIKLPNDEVIKDLTGLKYYGRTIFINDIEYQLPEGANLVLVVNGDCREVSGDISQLIITGDVRNIDLDKGSVSCRDVGGDVNVDAGNVECERVSGDISVNNGTIQTN